jgi:hypothetical protein
MVNVSCLLGCDGVQSQRTVLLIASGFISEDGGSRIFQSIGNHLQDRTVLQARRPQSTYYTSICLERLRKTMKNFSMNSWWCGLDLNCLPSEYNSGSLFKLWFSCICCSSSNEIHFGSWDSAFIFGLHYPGFNSIGVEKSCCDGDLHSFLQNWIFTL